MEPGQKTGTGETWSKGHTKDPVSGILDDQDQHSSSKARIMVLQRPVGVPNSAWHPGSLGGGAAYNKDRVGVLGRCGFFSLNSSSPTSPDI